ncbi:MAG: hypothetical protein JWM58_3753 [Rhizobium sp.]|nr:hypothetical protein [Rhizobium sp.]
MSDASFFFLFILPLIIAAIGAAIAFFYGRGGDKHPPLHPGE